ncbi:MAG: hypothetical protein R3Y09_02260 [Clostridia bacterium]
MDDILLKLTPYKKTSMEFNFSNPNNQIVRLENDKSYDLKILGLSQDIEYSLYINGNFVKHSQNGCLNIYNEWIFIEYIRHINFTLKSNGNDDLVLSNFIVEFDKNSEIGISVDNMIKYISDHNHLIDVNDNTNLKPMDLEYSKNQYFLLDMLNEILNAYKKNFTAFANKPHKTATTKPLVGDFEKVSHLSQETLTYIVTHPGFLMKTDIDTGIEFENEFYIPNKTLINSLYDVKDNYENRAIIGFLKTVIVFLLNKISEIDNQLEQIPTFNSLKQKYTISEKFYLISRKNLIFAKENIQKKIIEFKALYENYNKIFDFSAKEVIEIPIRTKIFEHLSHYGEIFNLIVYWFNNAKYSLLNEKINIHLAKSSCIYEHYILLKLINSLLSQGYQCLKKEIIVYNFIGENRFKDLSYNNAFTFEKNGTTKVLYYQPIINKRSIHKGINLYRSVSTSIGGYADKDNYYNPDYVLKTNSSMERYKIIDAKFSKRDNILRNTVHELVYKYIFSINVTNNDCIVDEVSIICGKSRNIKAKNLCDTPSPVTGSNGIVEVKMKLYDINPIDEDKDSSHNTLLRKIVL